MPRNEVVPTEPAGVPDLAPTPASTITAEDIAIPTIYMGHRAQSLVEAGFAKAGDIYAALGQDDSEVEILWEAKTAGEGVLILPLFMFKSFSYSPGVGQQLEMWPFEAKGRPYPDGPPLDDPDPRKRAWLTYNFTLYLPEVDPDMPYKTRFYRSGAPAALKINQVTSRNHDKPSYTNAWRWTTAQKQKPQVHTIPQLLPAQPTDEQVAGAARLFELLVPGLQRQAPTAPAEGAPSI